MKKIVLFFTLSFAFKIYSQSVNTQTNFEIKWYSKYDSIPIFIKFKPIESPVLNAENINKWFQSNLNANKQFNFKKISDNKDLEGNYHEKYTQYYQEYKVINSMVNLHFQKGKIQSLNGHYFPNLNIDITPTINEITAFKIALKQYPTNTKYIWELDDSNKLKAATPTGELCIVAKKFIHKQGNFRLAYAYTIMGMQPHFSEKIYIDAINGEVLNKINIQCDIEVPGRGLSYYDGIKNFICDSISNDSIFLTKNESAISVFNLKSNTDFALAQLYNHRTNHWGKDSLLKKNVAVDVYWAMDKTLNFYSNVLQRESYDGNGSPIVAVVNYDVGFNNAFWNGSFAAFGNGDGKSMNPLVTLDICGHEITHGLTGNSAELIYMDESGALNESFSDIFGKCIEHAYQKNNFTWTIANKVMTTGFGFRNMQNPAIYSNPKYYQGRYYYNGSENNGGVHTNSGVQNHWFYLLCQGGTERNESTNITHKVDSIGWQKATRIAYSNLTNYLTPMSDYYESSLYSTEAAGLMYGRGSHVQKQVILAWHLAGLSDLTNIENITISKNIELFPNPTDGKLNLKIKNILVENLSFNILDITGKNVLSAQLNASNTIDVSNFEKGIYFIQFGDSSVLKFIKL